MSANPDTGPDIDADADADTEIQSDADPDIDIRTESTMRERTDMSRLKFWLVLSANRLLVTGLLALLVFVSLIVFGVVLYPPFPSALVGAKTLETMFSTMLIVITTGTTLVVTIGQLVISEENGPLGEQHRRMNNTMDFRTYTRELIDHPSPSDPSAFLREIINTAEGRADALRDAIADNDDDQLRAEVDAFTNSLTSNAETVRDELDDASFGTFGVLSAALDFNYGWKIFQVERIANDHADSLTAEDRAILDGVRTALTMFGPAREHIKTLYFEWELINLSQLILYVSVPALVVAAGMLSFVSASSFPGVTVGIPDILWVTTGAFTVTLLPFLLLVAYILRVATFAKRTLAIGPLVLRDSQR